MAHHAAPEMGRRLHLRRRRTDVRVEQLPEHLCVGVQGWGARLLGGWHGMAMQPVIHAAVPVVDDHRGGPSEADAVERHAGWSPAVCGARRGECDAPPVRARGGDPKGCETAAGGELLAV